MFCDCPKSKLAIFLAYSALFATALSAQDYRGRIQGTVWEAAKAVIPGATVTLTNTGTSIGSTQQTNQDGTFLFGLVVPGTYSLTVESSGFRKFATSGIVMRQRGDVTVDATLMIGSVSESISVVADGAQVQFNSSKLDTTIDSQIAGAIPQYQRNPFFFSKLDPSVVQSESRLESQPYHSTGTGTQTVGGVTGSDFQVDGAPVGLGNFTGYVPSPDMVQEVNVQVNAIDAEFGQSTGAAVSVTLKSGTNKVSGVAFYQGVYPWANAVLNRVNRTPNIQRNHIFGGTVGNPIIKNKWFNFAAFEGWELTDPQTVTGQLPSVAERTGNFSQSKNAAGALRTVFDPTTTVTSADGRTVTRQPFAGNVIPASQISKVAAAYTAALPAANAPSVGNYGARNYVVPLKLFTPYRNFSNRSDVHLRDNLRYAGRVSFFRTPISADNPLGSDLAWKSDRGSNRHALQISNELTWIKSARTIVSGGFSYYGFIDEAFPTTDFKGYDSLWPNNSWYKSIFSSGAIPQVSPGMVISHGDGGSIMSSYSSGIGTNGPFWRKHSKQNQETLKVAHQYDKHYLKFGFESRYGSTWQLPQISWPSFNFNATSTASTYLNPDTRVSGDGYASFLLGAVNGATMPARVTARLFQRTYALFLNDDFKLSRRITLNLGLRWELEQPFREEEDRAARGVDLTVPIPELQGVGAPQMSAAVRQFYQGTWTFNGAYRWTGNGQKGQWAATTGTLSPRAGIAVRLDSKSSLRAGWGRYYSPWLRSSNLTQGNFYGFALETTAPAPLLGIPQMSLDNPFPAGSFPVQAVTGKTLGDYTGLGSALSWFANERPRQNLDRINVSYQREILGMVGELTYFLNTFNAPGARNVNMMDPRIAYTNKTAINQSVLNPFYNILTAQKFPGTLRNQANIPLSSLMVPYPQYGALSVTDFENNGGGRFHQMSFRLRKGFTRGLAFLGGYSYTYAKNLNYYDDQDQFLQQRTWIDDTQPRNRITFGGTWQFPLGRGRMFLSAAPRLLDALVGGWNFSPVMTWRSGNYLSFPGLIANGNPKVDNPSINRWFDTSVFQVLPAFTRRSNPWIYDGVTGPGFFNLDMSMVKSFAITERFSAEMRIDSFNLPNSMTWNDPSTAISSTFFGKSSGQFNLNGVGVGRTSQMGLRIRF
jgi:Carboxypeptidase regulatory-like domain